MAWYSVKQEENFKFTPHIFLSATPRTVMTLFPHTLLHYVRYKQLLQVVKEDADEETQCSS